MRKYDTPLAIFFTLCSISLLFAFIFNHDLLDWAFARHHNQLSWYIRPIFIIPFCFFCLQEEPCWNLLHSVLYFHIHVLVPGTDYRRYNSARISSI